jgi:hypothetical protein
MLGLNDDQMIAFPMEVMGQDHPIMARRLDGHHDLRDTGPPRCRLDLPAEDPKAFPTIGERDPFALNSVRILNHSHMTLLGDIDPDVQTILLDFLAKAPKLSHGGDHLLSIAGSNEATPVDLELEYQDIERSPPLLSTLL